MNIPPNPYETYPGPQEAKKVQCHECQRRDVVADKAACLDGKYFCERCLDPKQPAFDMVVTMFEHMEAEIQGLKAERLKLTAELSILKRRAA
jgi:hypothetical protein